MRPTQRVLVALHTDKVEPYAALLEKLSKDKPLALICFGDMKMLEKIPVEKLWVNPDCGLKTRGDKETIPSLEHLVCAAQEVRCELSK